MVGSWRVPPAGHRSWERGRLPVDQGPP
jgi:hypothetical protein